MRVRPISARGACCSYTIEGSLASLREELLVAIVVVDVILLRLSYSTPDAPGLGLGSALARSRSLPRSWNDVSLPGRCSRRALEWERAHPSQRPGRRRPDKGGGEARQGGQRQLVGCGPLRRNVVERTTCDGRRHKELTASPTVFPPFTITHPLQPQQPLLPSHQPNSKSHSPSPTWTLSRSVSLAFSKAGRER